MGKHSKSRSVCQLHDAPQGVTVQKVVVSDTDPHNETLVYEDRHSTNSDPEAAIGSAATPNVVKTQEEKYDPVLPPFFQISPSFLTISCLAEQVDKQILVIR